MTVTRQMERSVSDECSVSRGLISNVERLVLNLGASRILHITCVCSRLELSLDLIDLMRPGENFSIRHFVKLH
jgi:hypothetical protein